MGALNEFHAKNWQRMHEAFPPAHDLKALAICVQEEVGELAAAVLGVTGEKARKAHLTNADVLDAVADAITYLSLVARTAGCEDLEELIGATFNMVSDRAGSPIKTVLGQAERETEGARIRAALLSEIEAAAYVVQLSEEGEDDGDPVEMVEKEAMLDALDRIIPEEPRRELNLYRPGAELDEA